MVQADLSDLNIGVWVLNLNIGVWVRVHILWRIAINVLKLKL